MQSHLRPSRSASPHTLVALPYLTSTCIGPIGPYVSLPFSSQPLATQDALRHEPPAPERQGQCALLGADGLFSVPSFLCRPDHVQKSGATMASHPTFCHVATAGAPPQGTSAQHYVIGCFGSAPSRCVCTLGSRPLFASKSNQPAAYGGTPLLPASAGALTHLGRGTQSAGALPVSCRPHQCCPVSTANPATIWVWAAALAAAATQPAAAAPEAAATLSHTCQPLNCKRQAPQRSSTQDFPAPSTTAWTPQQPGFTDSKGLCSALQMQTEVRQLHDVLPASILQRTRRTSSGGR